jgi:hypothetical protein
MIAELSDPRFGYVSSALNSSREYRKPPAAAILYDSPQSDCSNFEDFRKLIQAARSLAVFERNGKRAAVYALGGI